MDKPDENENDGAPHTLASVEFTLQLLKKAVAAVEGSVALMKIPPTIDALQIHRESSRLNGIKRIKSWADALRNAVDLEKDALLRPPPKTTDTPRKKPKEKAP